MKLLLMLLIACLVSACNNKSSSKYSSKTVNIFTLKDSAQKPEAGQNNTSDVEGMKPKPIVFNWDYYEFDTTTTSNALVDTNRILNRYSDYSEYYSVYKISRNLTGIAIDVNSPFDPLGKLLTSLSNFRSDKIADTSGEMRLQYSRKLEDAVLANDTTREFYIYCTKGRTVAKITGVLYEKNEDECHVNIVFTLSKIDTAGFGIPLIASLKGLQLTYSGFPGFQKDLEKYEAYLDTKVDYTDEIGSKVFAYNKDLVFTYEDNFLWHRRGYYRYNGKIHFPGRSVYKLNGKKIKAIGGGGLDLLGIPCI